MSRLKNAETKEPFQPKGNKETGYLGSVCGSGGNPAVRGRAGAGQHQLGSGVVSVPTFPNLDNHPVVTEEEVLVPENTHGSIQQKTGTNVGSLLSDGSGPPLGTRRGWGTGTQSRKWPTGWLGTRGQGCSGGPHASLASVSEFAMKRDKGKCTPKRPQPLWVSLLTSQVGGRPF